MTVSPALMRKATDSVYPIVYMDCIVVKVQQDGSVINKAVFLALGVNTEGQKELLACGWQETKAQSSGSVY
ncbi:transposase [Morganella morganii]|uniref:transposase n=1 Tax=Morganella morganii TaxID=582 RepID=UPI00351B34A2